MHDIIQTILAFAVFGAIGYAGWKQIPPESAETIAARKHYGKAE